MGVILFEVFTYSLPFLSIAEILEDKPAPDLPENFPKEINELIQK